MPTLLRKNGFRFLFYANDHAPPHVHVQKGGGEAKFNLHPFVELVESKGLKTQELASAEEIVETHRDEFQQAWTKHFP